jgi:hypothetical protein
MLDNISISKFNEQFEHGYKVIIDNLSLDRLARLHKEHKLGDKQVWIKFYDDYNLLRSLDNYPKILMFTGAFELVEAIYYITLPYEDSVEQEEAQPAAKNLDMQDTLVEPKTVWDLKMHEEMFLQANFTDEHTEGYRYDVMRVPGGWIYVTGEKVTTFVPYVDQIHNTGCTLCGNSDEKVAQQALDILNYLNDKQASINEDGDLHQVILDFLKG